MHEALAFRNSRDALGDFSQLYAVPWYRPTGKTRFPPANHPQLSILVYLLVTLVLKIWVLGIPHFKKPSNIIYIYHIYIIYIHISYIYNIYIYISYIYNIFWAPVRALHFSLKWLQATTALEQTMRPVRPPSKARVSKQRMT